MDKGMRFLSNCFLLVAIIVVVNTTSEAQLIFRDLGAHEVLYDGLRDELIVSLPDQNQVVRLNPRNLEHRFPIFDTTGNPTHLALSDSGNTLYIGFENSPQVAQIALATWSEVRRFGLGDVPGGSGLTYTYDIAVKPDNDDVIAVALRQFSSVRGLAVYDQGVRLPNVLDSNSQAGSIVFGMIPDTLYGADVTSSERGFRRYNVDAQGITLLSSVSGLLPGGVGHIVHVNDRIYTDRRSVFHGPTNTLLGMYSGRGMIVPSSALNRAFITDFSQSLMSFELDTFNFVEMTHDLNYQGGIRSLTRWGDDGFAFTTSQGYIYSMRSSLAWNQLRLPPASLTVLRGITLQGNLESLTAPDNNRLIMRPGITFTTTQSPVEIEIRATSPLLNPEGISLSMEMQGSSVSVVQTVSFYDYIQSAFVIVSERPTRNEDERTQCDVFDIGHRFVDPVTGSVRARISYKPNGPVFSYPWSVQIDLARWVLPQ